MELPPKAKRMLQILLQTDGKITVQALADQMKVSKRTVQREMDDINSFLKGTGVSLLTKMGKGIWLDGEEDKKQALLSELMKTEVYDAGNREERRKRLILEILKEKELKKQCYYSSKFKVSESTISGDLEAVEGWFRQYGIRIIRRTGSGIEVQGEETDYRRAIRVFIEENINTDFLKEAYENEDIPDFAGQIKGENIKNIFSQDILKQVMECIAKYEKKLLVKLTESAFTGLIIHVTIAVDRILKGEIIEKSDELEEIVRDEDYILAEELTRSLERKFEIEIPKVETIYIYLHLKGAKHEKIQWNDRNEHEESGKKMLRIVNEMIDVFDPKDAWLYKQDNEFIQGLLAHLQPTVIRLLYHMKINNPVLDTVKQEYKEVYQRCVGTSKVLEKHLNREIPEDEIGFLAIHFGAAKVRLESQREKLRPVHVGVVCASGIGISRLMSSRLKQAFRDRVQISVYGKRDITPYITAKTDFFVSSIQMEKTEIPTVFVNPFLNEEDMEAIHKLIYQYERMPEKSQEQDTFSQQLEKINLVTAQINAVIKYLDVFQVKADISFDSLLEVIGERLSPYQDRKEIIIRDIQNRERIASQIFAEFGFALLHSRSQGVIRPTLAICLPKQEDHFTDAYFKEIQIVFVMMIPEDENIDINGEILGYLSNLFLEEKTLEEIISGGSKEEIQNIISKYLKKFFQEYLEMIK